MNAQLTEIMRLITNLIRTGVVTEVDRENWLDSLIWLTPAGVNLAEGDLEDVGVILDE